MDAAREAARLRNQTRERRRRPYRKSRLDRHAHELLALRGHGTTVAELQRWLRTKRRVKVSHSTVARWLRQHGTG